MIRWAADLRYTPPEAGDWGPGEGGFLARSAKGATSYTDANVSIPPAPTPPGCLKAMFRPQFVHHIFIRSSLPYALLCSSCPTHLFSEIRVAHHWGLGDPTGRLMVLKAGGSLSVCDRLIRPVQQLHLVVRRKQLSFCRIESEGFDLAVCTTQAVNGFALQTKVFLQLCVGPWRYALANHTNLSLAVQ